MLDIFVGTGPTSLEIALSGIGSLLLFGIVSRLWDRRRANHAQRLADARRELTSHRHAA